MDRFGMLKARFLGTLNLSPRGSQSASCSDLGSSVHSALGADTATADATRN
jgi:hypothetical protein